MKNQLNLKLIKKAVVQLSQQSEMKKNLFLRNLAVMLDKNRLKIISANKKDLEKTQTDNLSQAFVQRLVFQNQDLDKLINKVRAMQQLESGIGEIIEEKVITNGLRLKKIRVPIGVILIIYEARPEVTIDVAALCIKSGNVSILKGGSEALHTNEALYQCIIEALVESQFNIHSINFIGTKDRKIVSELLQHNDSIDLVIARGGYDMVKSIQKISKIPVLAHSSGGARIYIDKSADLSVVDNILINAKTTKPSACNSLDTIVIHQALARRLVSHIVKTLGQHNVVIVKEDWNTEFLSLKISIKVVKDVDEAIKFIQTYSKGHSEGIIANDKKIINKFVSSIDVAALFVNCSPRLHDGYIFGLGSEMGIATGRLHARGPVGLKELTIYKWIMYGKGHIRE